MSKAKFRVVKSYNKTPSGGGIGTDGLDDTCLIINEDTSNGKDNGIYLGTFDKCIANYTPAAVATSGSYNDLTDKPTIPTKLSQLTDDVVTGKYLPLSKFQVAEVANPSTVYLQSGIYRQSEDSHLAVGTSGWSQFITLHAGGDNWAQMYFSYDGKLHYRTATFGDGDPANIPWRAIITEKNIGDYKLSQFTDDIVTGKYLPITGGIINTAATTPLDIKNTQSNPTEVGIRFMFNNDSKGWIGYNTQSGTMLYTYNGAHKLGVKDDGTAYVDSNTLIHSGNIKNQYVAGVYDSYNPLMKITFNYAGDAVTSNPTWLACWTGYTLSYVSPDNVKAGRADSANKLNAEYLADLNNGTRGRLFYSAFQAANTPPGANHFAGLTFGYDSIKQIAMSYDGKLYTRYSNKTTWSNWKKVAFTDSNVASATKLQTPRKLWGNDFDGTADMSGQMYVSGDFFIEHPTTGRQLNIHHNWTILGYNNPSIGNPTYIDGRNVYIRYGNDEYASVFASNGNVGIGTTSPTGKLHVAGNIKMSGDLSSDIWRIIKDSTWNGTFIQSANYDDTSDLGNIYMSAIGGNKLTSFNVWANNSKFSNNVTVAGNVGIGTTSPSEKLDVAGNVKASAFCKKDSSDSYVLLGGGGHKSLSDFTDTNYYHTRSYSSGLQISTGTGVSNMYVPYATASQAGVVSTGSQTFAGAKTFNSTVTADAFYINSDERLKTFGDDIKVDFDELAKLRKSHFVFNDNPTKQEIGVSAQEVQKIYPEIVNETEEGTLSVDYSKLAVVALAAIDKLNQRVQELENKLAKYE